MPIKKFIIKTTKNKKSIDKVGALLYNDNSIMENYLAVVPPLNERETARASRG